MQKRGVSIRNNWKKLVFFAFIQLIFVCSSISPIMEGNLINLPFSDYKSPTFPDGRKPQKNDFYPISSKGINKSEIISMGDGILFQPYYWKVPDDGFWWQVVENYIPEWKENLGIDGLWLPPSQKTPFGDTSTYGYEPYDYYDLGEFLQKERVRTRYGTRTSLESLIQAANNLGIGAMADIVINHNNGGELEENPYAGEPTYTNFMQVASGRFPRNYSHFYPCLYGQHDNLAWGNLPDLCHLHPYVHDELLTYGKWLRDEIGYDGWRFDVAYGVAPSMIRDWALEVGGYSVSEFWNGIPITNQEIDDALNSVAYSTSGFDFPLMYEFRSMVMANGSYDMQNLATKGLMHLNPNKTITFVTNHDTQKDPSDTVPYHREMGYAYILTHEPYPMIFWKDYFDFDLHWHLRTLSEIRNRFAKGSTNVLYTDSDLYVMQRNGDPGLILTLNDNPTNWKTVTVNSKWRNTILNDLTGQAPSANVNENGEVTLSVPPMGYAIFSNHSMIRKVNPTINTDTFQTPVNISEGSIDIDGNFDYNWGSPVYIDENGDAGFRQNDINRVYIKSEEDFLNLGVGIGTLEWMKEPLHLIFAFNTREGGSREDPGLHEGVSFTGNDLPDEIYYAILNNQTQPGYMKRIENITHYSWNGQKWENKGLINNSRFDTNPYFGFVEFQIPFEELGFSNSKQTEEFQVLVYSSSEGSYGIMDTSPQNELVDPSGESFTWLTLPPKLRLIMPQSSNNTTDSSSDNTNETESPSSSKISSYSLVFLITTLGCTVVLLNLRKKLR